MTRFLTLVLAAVSFLAVSCAQMKKGSDCSACCDSTAKAKPAAACCDSTKPHKH
ncbi:MAG TPA: hypothetical protein VD994_07680 [Prosthecobacter sp.]|nr:hypothetical protein [Prosthecobacter sp.]